MNSFTTRWLAGILVALLLLAGIGGALFWFKLQGLKADLVRNLGQALGARVEVSSLDLDLWKGELHAAGISLANERAGAPWEKGQINQATVRFRLRDIFAPVMPLSVEVSAWSVVLHPYVSGHSQGDAAMSAEPGSTSVSTRTAIRVTRLSAREGEVEIHLADNKQVVLHGVSFEASDNGAAVWTTDLQAGAISAGSLEVGRSSVQIRGDRDTVTFSNLRMACAQGFITGEGELALNGPHAARVKLTAMQVPITMLVGVQWQMKLSGLVGGELNYDGNDQAAAAHGQFVVDQGKFNVLPWLGKVTAVVGLPDISDVYLDKATSDFEWKNQTLRLMNLDIRKNDVVRIAGEVTVDPNSQVDGKLKLGLPSTVTAKWPQLQDKVFSVSLEDYNWTDVHLTGTPDHLQEDLTPRLLAVGMQQGGDLLNAASQKAMDFLKSFAP